MPLFLKVKKKKERESNGGVKMHGVPFHPPLEAVVPAYFLKIIKLNLSKIAPLQKIGAKMP